MPALLKRAHDRGATFRLHRHHPRAFGTDPPQCFQFFECLPHADQTGPAAGGIDDDIRKSPAELLKELKSHRLLPLDPIRLLQGGEVHPSLVRRPLAHQAGAVGDEAPNRVDPRAQ